VVEYLVDDGLILDAGNHFSFAATLLANRHIDVEYPFQALYPGHGLVALLGCFVFVFLSGASFSRHGRRHINTVFAVGGKYVMEPGQIYSGLWNQGRQLCNEIQRFEDDVRGAIAVWRFELITDVSRGCQ